MADEELEESWKDLRPDLPEPKKGVKFSPDEIRGIAKVLAGDDYPGLIELFPDRLQEEATTDSGLIVPPGTIPEFVGRIDHIPVRSEITVLGADEVNQPTLGWTFHEITDEERDERDSPESLAQLAQQRQAPPPHYNTSHRYDYEEPDHRGYFTLPVLQSLWGTPWNAGAANFLQCLRPSGVRVIAPREGMTLDAVHWRVTVVITEEGSIERIEQEVEVGLVGFRNGQDAHNYLDGREEALERPQATAIFNTRGIHRMTLDSDEG
jgi:hypothetical protein